VGCVFALLAALTSANDIPGVQAAAHDQPQLNGALVRSGDTPLIQYLFGVSYFMAFLDTGASGIVLTPFYAVRLGFDLPPYV
jgi:hypothetical protein